MGYYSYRVHVVRNYGKLKIPGFLMVRQHCSLPVSIPAPPTIQRPRHEHFQTDSPSGTESDLNMPGVALSQVEAATA